MKLKYFCLECKTLIDSGDALVVDDTCPGTFCSESCIEDFYDNQMRDFEEQERVFREENSLIEYANPDILNEQLEEIFENPDDLIHHTNSLGHSYFLYQKQVRYLDEEWVAIVIALHADEVPSLVLFKTLTQKPELVEFFMMKNLKQEVSEDGAEVHSSEEIELPKELMEWVEQKKSSVLAEHLEERVDEDIPFDEFMDFESYLMPTLNDPDEIYVNKDSEGDELYTYIKAFEKEGSTFYYFALCVLPDWEDKPDDLDEMQVFIPVLTFPSTDGKMYHKYSSGKKYVGKLKN